MRVAKKILAAACCFFFLLNVLAYGRPDFFSRLQSYIAAHSGPERQIALSLQKIAHVPVMCPGGFEDELGVLGRDLLRYNDPPGFSRWAEEEEDYRRRQDRLLLAVNLELSKKGESACLRGTLQRSTANW